MELTLNEYHTAAMGTAIYPGKGQNIVYPCLKLAGETGEVSEIVGKMIRDNQGVLSDEIKQKIKRELGDVLWYIAALADEIGCSMEDIAKENLTKLKLRAELNLLNGSGSDREQRELTKD